MTGPAILCPSSPISLSGHAPLRRRQVSNALRDVHPVPGPAGPKDEQRESEAPKARPFHERPTPDADIG